MIWLSLLQPAHSHTVIPANAGIQWRAKSAFVSEAWIPAFAGMTGVRFLVTYRKFPLHPAEQHSRGGRGRRGLSERSEFRRRPLRRSSAGKPVRAGARGALLFGCFLLGKQEKATRPPAETGEVGVGFHRSKQHLATPSYRRKPVSKGARSAPLLGKNGFRPE